MTAPTDLSQDRVCDRFSTSSAGAFQGDMTGFFDDHGVFEGLPVRLGKPVMMDPQKHGLDDESLIRIREAVQFEYDVPLHNGGNTGIRKVNIVFTERNEDGIPLHSVFEAVDESGGA